MFYLAGCVTGAVRPVFFLPGCLHTLQEGRQYLDQLNSSIGRDALLLRAAAEAIEEVRRPRCLIWCRRPAHLASVLENCQACLNA